MHASDLQTSITMVDRHTSAQRAARLIADGSLPGLVIADAKGKPVTVISAVDVLGLLIPGYIRQDMSLAGVFDEKGAEEIWQHLDGRTIGDLLDDDGVHTFDLITVDSDATVVEIAAQMAEARAMIALVDSPPESEPVFITLPTVMKSILSFKPTHDDAETPA